MFNQTMYNQNNRAIYYSVLLHLVLFGSFVVWEKFNFDNNVFAPDDQINLLNVKLEFEEFIMPSNVIESPVEQTLTPDINDAVEEAIDIKPSQIMIKEPSPKPKVKPKQSYDYSRIVENHIRQQLKDKFNVSYSLNSNITVTVNKNGKIINYSLELVTDKALRNSLKKAIDEMPPAPLPPFANSGIESKKYEIVLFPIEH